MPAFAARRATALHRNMLGQETRRSLAQLGFDFGGAFLPVVRQESHAASYIALGDNRCSYDHMIGVVGRHMDGFVGAVVLINMTLLHQRFQIG